MQMMVKAKGGPPFPNVGGPGFSVYGSESIGLFVIDNWTMIRWTHCIGTKSAYRDFMALNQFYVNSPGLLTESMGFKAAASSLSLVRSRLMVTDTDLAIDVWTDMGKNNDSCSLGNILHTSRFRLTIKAGLYYAWNHCKSDVKRQ